MMDLVGSVSTDYLTEDNKQKYAPSASYLFNNLTNQVKYNQVVLPCQLIECLYACSDTAISAESYPISDDECLKMASQWRGKAPVIGSSNLLKQCLKREIQISKELNGGNRHINNGEVLMRPLPHC